jgi:hypothetical protein
MENAFDEGFRRIQNQRHDENQEQQATADQDDVCEHGDSSHYIGDQK